MKIGKNEALLIARNDARTVYRNLDDYEVRIELDQQNWKIDYEPKDQNANGGGPHYLIDGDTGAILSRRYEQ